MAPEPHVPRSKLRMTESEPGRANSVGLSNWVAGVATPESSAAAVVTILKTDPGA